MAAKYILASLALAFLLLAAIRIARDGANMHPQSRTWLLIGGLFGVVSAWLFYQE